MKRFKWLLIGVLVVILVIVIGVAIFIYDRLSSDTIELGKTRGELAFMSDRNGNWDIFIIDEEGNLQNLTEGSDGQDFFFNFTFDGDVVNFYSSATGEVGPAIVNADGTDMRTLSFAEAVMAVFMEGNIDFDPAWAPDGERLAWSSVRDLNVELYVSNVDGSDEQKVTSGGASDGQQAWSPDGEKLVYISDPGESQDVFVLDLASKETTQLSSDELFDFQPVWSLEGDQILFVTESDEPLETGAFDLVLINPDGTGRRLLGEDEVFKGDPTYSPYGGQVAFMSNEEGNWHIYVMDPDGSNVRRITDGDSNNMFPAWRPVPADESADETEASGTE